MLKLTRRIWLLLLCGLLCAASDPCLNSYQTLEQETQAFLKDKSKAKYHSNWEKLITKFERIPKSYPACEKADEALLRAGRLWLQCAKLSGSSADLKKALADFEALAGKYPESSLADDALLEAGKLHLKLGEKPSAEKAFQKIVTDYPQGDCAAQARKFLSELLPSSPAKPGGTSSEPKQIIAPASPEPSSTAPIPPAKAPLRPNDAIALLLDQSTPAKAKGPAQMQNLRYWSAGTYTRVVIELDRAAEFTPPRLLKPDPAINTPPRIFLDLNHTRLTADFRARYAFKDNCYELPIGDGLLMRARAGQYQPEVVRVVLDLHSLREFKYFSLPAGEEPGWRIIIDIYGEQKTAPSLPPPTRPTPKPGTTVLPSPKPLPVPETPQPAPKPPSQKPFIIIIDPGHGGKDPGALGRNKTREKDITLAVAKELEKELKKIFPRAQIVLTRKDDRYLSLVERTAKANALASDFANTQDAIFISLHCNANPSRKIAGVETYYLDNTTDRAALRLAAQENFVSEEVMSRAGDYTNQILADMATTSKVNFSIPLAECIQQSLVRELQSKYSGVNNLGVKKAPFWVLTGATMPSVLVELSFISNLQEEKRLSQSGYQKTLAKGIAAGLKKYEYQAANGQVVLP